jgi:NADH dehydrogenase
VEAGPRILPSFDARLAARARSGLEAIGVEVLTGTRVTDIRPGTVWLEGKPLDTRTVIWAAGVQASPAAVWLGCAADRVGRVIVDEHLRIQADHRIFVVGDTAAHTPEGAVHPLPGLAPVAKQMGKHVALVIKADLAGKLLPSAFRYRNWGTMATIGRNKAIADFGTMKLYGFPAWIAWSLTHVAFLDGFANRVSVAANWFWSYLTWQRGARVISMPVRRITGEEL